MLLSSFKAFKECFLRVLGRFYLPHGITTDKDNNYWVTDVALHQVRTIVFTSSLALVR
jgi:hypothetical protein